MASPGGSRELAALRFRSKSHNQALRWPHALAKRGARLLDRQCWAWGQDIKRVEGNLLLQYGFTRLRPTAGVQGCSQYTFAIDAEQIVRVWGFGVFAGSDEGVYLNRFAFVPTVTQRQDAWSAASFVSLPRVRSLHHVLLFLRWVTAYEDWIRATVGERYRAATLSNKFGADTPDLAAQWRNFAAEVRARMGTQRSDVSLKGCFRSAG